MLSRTFGRLSLAAGLVATLGLTGCQADCFRPAKADTKPIATETAAPRASGAAYSIEISPVTDTNPVRTQHAFVATVRDSSGNPVSGERVEWILAGSGRETVGEIVSVDGDGKVDNHYAVSYTGSGSRTVDRGNADPSDDIQLGAGQTYCVITSANEGSSQMISYAPAIENWDYHKAFATKHWADITWEWPADAVNRVGTPHRIPLRLMRYSDGTPLSGYVVNYKVVSGPAGSLTPGNGSTASVRTDESGVASVTLNQSSPAEGTNEVEITVIRPGDEKCCLPEKLIVSGIMTKTWVKPSIAIEKTAPATATVGGEFMYDIIVTNTSDLEITNAVLTDPLPNGIEYVSSNPAAQVSGNNLTWNLGNIEGGGTRSATITVRATRSGEFENCATVTADAGLNARACARTVVTAPSIEIVKRAPAEVLICDPITYEIVVTNTGDGPATGVRVYDRLPAGLTSSDGRTELTWDLGTLGAGESQTLTASASASSTGNFTNTASVSADGGLSAEASATTRVRQPVLGITKTVDRDQFYAGRPITWTMTVTSSGDVEARDVILEDAVPAGTTFVSATDGGRLMGGNVAWNLGTMAPGSSKTVSMTVRADTQGTIRNTATARAYCADSVAADASTTVTGVAAILLELIDTDDPLEIDGNTTYVIDVTNQGSANDTNVVIECTLPAQQEFVSAENDRGVPHTVSGKTVTFSPLAVLEPKARTTYRVVIRATGLGDVRFAVKLTSDVLDSPVQENESTHIY